MGKGESSQLEDQMNGHVIIRHGQNVIISRNNNFASEPFLTNVSKQIPATKSYGLSPVLTEEPFRRKQISNSRPRSALFLMRRVTVSMADASTSA